MRASIRKPLMMALGFLCLIMSVIGGLLPVLQGWIFFVIALYIFAQESETARRWIKWARRRWPWLSRQIEAARKHRWAPRQLDRFAERTDPDR